MGNECDNVNTEESMTNNFEANLVGDIGRLRHTSTTIRTLKQRVSSPNFEANLMGDIGRLRHTSTPIRTLNSMFEVKGVFCCISITQHWETFFQIMAP